MPKRHPKSASRTSRRHHPSSPHNSVGVAAFDQLLQRWAKQPPPEVQATSPGGGGGGASTTPTTRKRTASAAPTARTSKRTAAAGVHHAGVHGARGGGGGGVGERGGNIKRVGGVSTVTTGTYPACPPPDLSMCSVAALKTFCQQV